MAIFVRDFKQDMTPTKIVVTHPVFIAGVPRKKGDEVIVGYQDAIDLQAMKRATLIGRIEKTVSGSGAPDAGLGEAP